MQWCLLALLRCTDTCKALGTMRGTMCRYITATHDEDGMRGFNMNDYNVRACVRSHLALHTLLTGDQFLSTD